MKEWRQGVRYKSGPRINNASVLNQLTAPLLGRQASRLFILRLLHTEHTLFPHRDG